MVSDTQYHGQSKDPNFFNLFIESAILEQAYFYCLIQYFKSVFHLKPPKPASKNFLSPDPICDPESFKG